MIINADARDLPLGENTVQTIITSPPYWALRDYAGDSRQIGQEPTPDEYINDIARVGIELRRALKPDGTFWLILGDTYSQGRMAPHTGWRINRDQGGMTGKAHNLDGIPPKNLLGIPWRVALTLQAMGWWLRADIIWHKPNPMPESVRDRPTRAHEYIFLLSKSRRYYYNADAIRTPLKESSHDRGRYGWNGRTGDTEKVGARSGRGFERLKETGAKMGTLYHPLGANKKSVWTVSTVPFKGAHFAAFPPALVEPMILAGSRPGDIVLDPFAGTGTVGAVCRTHNRRFVGVEIVPGYIEMAKARIGKTAPGLF